MTKQRGTRADVWKSDSIKYEEKTGAGELIEYCTLKTNVLQST